MTAPFASTAPYYARYRPPYPVEFHALLADRFALDGSQTVLDLGTGPGTIALPLAPAVDHVYAVDPEPAMLAEGVRLAQERGCANISWLRGVAADVTRLCLPRIDLCVIGEAFHRMDRARVPADLDAVLAPRGGIALITRTAGPDAPRPPWTAVVDEVCARYLGPDYRAARAVAAQRAGDPDDLGDMLAKSPFSRVESAAWEQSVVLTPDQVVGLQLSYAHCGPALFGDRKDAFASDVRRALLDHDPGGRYTWTVPVAVTVATRPRR